MLDPERKSRKAFAGRVMNGVRDRGRNSDHRDFAKALHAKRVDLRIGLSMNATWMEPISAFTGIAYSARSALRKAAETRIDFALLA